MNIRKLSNRKKTGIVAVGILIIVLAVFLMPGPIDGCYFIRQPQGQGNEFLAFKNGSVWGCVDNHPMPPEVVNLGTYSFEEHVGWIWTLRKYERRISCKPHLLFIRFRAVDGDTNLAAEPFEWRDPFYWTTKRTLQTKEFEDAVSKSKPIH